MNPDQLRQTIVRATVPLIGEYETLTTAQIARAAGIGEADLLAVFADKEAVMQAWVATLTETMAAVLDSAEEVREIGGIPTDQPLASRLVKVIDILDAYNRRIRVDLDDLLPASVLAAGTADAPGIRPSDPQDDVRSLNSRSSEIRQAVTKLLEPDQQHLRLPAQVLAAAFVGMTFGGVRPGHPGQAPLPAEEVVDLFLHGALNSGPAALHRPAAAQPASRDGP
jgi:AcrR family transcriptional regulator